MLNGLSNEPVGRDALKRLGTSLCGRYQLVRLIGLGGMAAVYAGRHRNGHPVAIKVLHERFRESSIERSFRREARLANTVAHPVVVPVIDDDVTEDGCVFLVMPLLRGETARARAERLGGRLPVEEVVAIGHAVLSALAAAHREKIVHRDLKPENIFVSDVTGVRLLDFGIGRMDEGKDPALSTHQGRVIGTPAFMAPEQALGRSPEIDGRTDVWGMGATLFTLLSGQFVHTGQTAGEVTVRAATAAAAPLEVVAPHVQAELREVVNRALRFDSKDRWQDAASMSAALSRACEACFGRRPDQLAPLVVPDQAREVSLADAPTSQATPDVSPAPAPTKAVSAGDTTSTPSWSPAYEPTLLPVNGASPLTSARSTSLKRGALLGFAILLGGVTLSLGARRANRAPAPTAGSEVAAMQGVDQSPPVRNTAVAVSATSQPQAPPSVAHVAPAVTVPTPRAAPAPPRTQRVIANCDPPYSLDSAGHHVYKPECD